MRTIRWWTTLMVVLAAAPAAWSADRSGAVDVELWTDRGNDAVYEPGDEMQLRVRTSHDGYLLVYEIDSEGYVRLLWPDHGSRGFVEGRQTLHVPSPQSNLELVVERATGEGYLVAISSDEPFRELPWYLRPYNEQADDSEYQGEADDDDGITQEGRIVGDPFVAMERIRRSVLRDPEDADAFGTAYTTYYVHERVRYPRYLCNDCHRPGYWAWWDGFDPYYATCSVFDFRVNWGWYWGPTYWFGTVPYYYYAVRNDCPPRYRFFSSHGNYSSWNGWRSWQDIMGGSLRRYKSPPPPGYIPPTKFRERTGGATPPGFLVSRDVAPGRHGGGLRSTDARWREQGGRGVLQGSADRIERPRDVPRGGLVGRDGGDRWRDGGGADRHAASKDVGDRILRPRGVPRGWNGRDDLPTRGQGSDGEPSRPVRGINERWGDGGMHWSGRRSDSESRPRDDRPYFRTPPVEHGRSEPRLERAPRTEFRPAGRHEERPHDDGHRAPERRSDNRDGDRDHGGRPGR